MKMITIENLGLNFVSKNESLINVKVTDNNNIWNKDDDDDNPKSKNSNC